MIRRLQGVDPLHRHVGHVGGQRGHRDGAAHGPRGHVGDGSGRSDRPADESGTDEGREKEPAGYQGAHTGSFRGRQYLGPTV